MIREIDERKRIAIESLILDDLELNGIVNKIVSVVVNNVGVATLVFEVDDKYVNDWINKQE